MLSNDRAYYVRANQIFRNPSTNAIQQLSQLVTDTSRSKWQPPIQPSVKKIIGIKKNSSIERERPLCELTIQANCQQDSICDLSYSNRSGLPSGRQNAQSSRNQRTQSVYTLNKENFPEPIRQVCMPFPAPEVRSQTPIYQRSPLQRVQSPQIRVMNQRGCGSVSPLRCPARPTAPKRQDEPQLQNVVDNLKQNIIRDIQEVTRKYQSNTPKPLELLQKQNERIKQLLEFKEPSRQVPYFDCSKKPSEDRLRQEEQRRQLEERKLQQQEDFRKQQQLEQQSIMLQQQLELIKQQSIRMKQMKIDIIEQQSQRCSESQFKRQKPYPNGIHNHQNLAALHPKETIIIEEVAPNQAYYNKPQYRVSKPTDETEEDFNSKSQVTISNLSSITPAEVSANQNKKLNVSFESSLEQQQFDFFKASDCRNTFGPLQLERALRSPKGRTQRSPCGEQSPCQPDFDLESSRKSAKRTPELFDTRKEGSVNSVKSRGSPCCNPEGGPRSASSQRYGSETMPQVTKTPQHKDSTSGIPSSSNHSNRYEQMMQQFQSIKNQTRSPNFIIETKKSVQIVDCQHISDFIIHSHTQRESIQEVRKKLVTFQENNQSQEKPSKFIEQIDQSGQTEQTEQTEISKNLMESLKSSESQMISKQRTTSFAEFLRMKGSQDQIGGENLKPFEQPPQWCQSREYQPADQSSNLRPIKIAEQQQPTQAMQQMQPTQNIQPLRTSDQPSMPLSIRSSDSQKMPQTIKFSDQLNLAPSIRGSEQSNQPHSILKQPQALQQQNSLQTISIPTPTVSTPLQSTELDFKIDPPKLATIQVKPGISFLQYKQQVES